MGASFSRRLATSARLLVVMLVFVSVAQLRAQFGTATLSGTVADPTGASVPSAQVTLEGELEKTARQTTTNTAGLYVIPAVPPGTYRLVVKASGFVPQTLTDIVLTSGQGSTLNVQLTVASTTTQVSVHAAAPLLETTTATVGSEVTAQQFTSLPMLGRNFTTLLDMLPGVANVLGSDSTYAPSGVNGAAVLPSVYGQRQRDNYVSLDGIMAEDPDNGRISMLPPPEGIAEMKVETSTDSGAYGWGPGASINIVTKSGTNAYHGDAWEFFRNGALNARSYFVPSIGPFHWNQFGFAGGGPLEIPHILSKDRAWYVFGYYEGIRHHQQANFTTLVPSPCELAGNFGACASSGGNPAGDAPIYNPYTTVLDSNGNITSRQQFNMNQIPGSLINSTTQALAQTLYPAPNLAYGVVPGANYINTTPLVDDSNQWTVRVDHQFGTKDSFFVRYSDWRNPVSEASYPSLPYVNRNHYTNITGSDTYSFNPNFLVTMKFGLNRSTNYYVVGGPDVVQTLNLQNDFPTWTSSLGPSADNLLRSISIPGYGGLGQGDSTDGPEYFLSWGGDATLIHGRHTLGFGGRFIRSSFYLNCVFGYVCFGSAQTALPSVASSGNALASYLLGLPAGGQRVGGTTWANTYWHNYSYYAQDTLHASKRLTLNLGLRWDYQSPPVMYPGMGTFDWNTGNYYFDTHNPATGQAPNIRRGLVPPDYRGYQPRVGIAYQVTPKTVIRASGGTFLALYGANLQALGGVEGNWPWASVDNVTGLNTGLPTSFFASMFPGPLLSLTPNGCEQCANVETSSSRNPYVEEWSLSVQRQITPSLMFETAYVGSHGVKESSQIVDNTALEPGTNPYTERQRWPNFAPYVMNGYNEFMSWYHGLSVRVQHQTSKNLTFLVSYTYSKALDQMDSLLTGYIYGQGAW